MKNYIQNGENIAVTAKADIASGAGVLVGALFGVATGNVKSGAKVTLVRIGVFELPKTSEQAWTEGAKVYWDDTNKLCTTTKTSNTLIGVAARAAKNPSPTGSVLLDGAAR